MSTFSTWNSSYRKSSRVGSRTLICAAWTIGVWTPPSPTPSKACCLYVMVLVFALSPEIILIVVVEAAFLLHPSAQRTKNPPFVARLLPTNFPQTQHPGVPIVTD